MESTLSYEVEDILKRSVLYRVNTKDYSIEKLGNLESGDNTEDSQEFNVKIAFPPSEDQYKNVSSGSYEGGYTIWESTWVLLSFIKNIEINENSSILELGAGIGVCGTLLSLKGHKVTFQDLNINVIKRGLIPNLLVNHIICENKSKNDEVLVTLNSTYDDEIKNIYQFETDSIKYEDKVINFKFEFLIGDWNHIIKTKNISTHLKNKYDIIIASECIYRIENYKSIIKIIHTFMNKNGKTYIATKRFYFGLSGGTYQFLEYISNYEYEEEEEQKLSAKIIRSVEPKNSSNVIDIIEITKVKI